MKTTTFLFVMLMMVVLSGCDLLGNKQLECEEGYYEYEGFCVDEDKIYDEDDVRYTFIRLRLNTDDIENLYSNQEYCKDYFINFDECADFLSDSTKLGYNNSIHRIDIEENGEFEYLILFDDYYGELLFSGKVLKVDADTKYVFENLQYTFTEIEKPELEDYNPIVEKILSDSSIEEICEDIALLNLPHYTCDQSLRSEVFSYADTLGDVWVENVDLLHIELHNQYDPTVKIELTLTTFVYESKIYVERVSLSNHTPKVFTSQHVIDYYDNIFDGIITEDNIDTFCTQESLIWDSTNTEVEESTCKDLFRLGDGFMGSEIEIEVYAYSDGESFEVFLSQSEGIYSLQFYVKFERLNDIELRTILGPYESILNDQFTVGFAETFINQLFSDLDSMAISEVCDKYYTHDVLPCTTEVLTKGPATFETDTIIRNFNNLSNGAFKVLRRDEINHKLALVQINIWGYDDQYYIDDYSYEEFDIPTIESVEGMLNTTMIETYDNEQFEGVCLVLDEFRIYKEGPRNETCAEDREEDFAYGVEFEISNVTKMSETNYVIEMKRILTNNSETYMFEIEIDDVYTSERTYTVIKDTIERIRIE